MPSWNIHLEVGERVAKRLDFDAKKKKEFLAACILPDVNNGYINNPGVRKEHEETHYAYDQKSSLNFYAENREKVNDREPVYLGYLCHLYTDGYFNYDFYRKIKRDPLGEGKNHDEKRKIKHHDFWLFDTKFHHELGINEEEAAEIAKKASKIKAVEISGEDLLEVEEILKRDNINDFLKGEKYQFYTEEDLKNLLEDMVESFCNDYLEGD